MATIRQRKTFKALGETGGNISKAMVKAGYSKVTAHHTEKLTKSKGWQELLDTCLSDKKLTKLHERILEKKEKIVVSDGVKDGSHIEDTGQPHSDAVKGLEIAYKLKHRFSDEEKSSDKVIIVNVSTIVAQKNGISPTPEHNSGGSPQV